MNRGIDLDCNVIDSLSIPNDRNRGTVCGYAFQSYSIPLLQRVEIEGLPVNMHECIQYALLYVQC